MKFADRLRTLRREKKVTNAELARRTRFGRSTLLQLQNGRRSNPTIETMLTLAPALGVTVAELLEGVDES